MVNKYAEICETLQDLAVSRTVFRRLCFIFLFKTIDDGALFYATWNLLPNPRQGWVYRVLVTWSWSNFLIRILSSGQNFLLRMSHFQKRATFDVTRSWVVIKFYRLKSQYFSPIYISHVVALSIVKYNLPLYLLLPKMTV